MTAPSIIRYEVTNTRTGDIKSYKTSAAAERAMDTADRKHGACITTRKAIWSDQA